MSSLNPALSPRPKKDLAWAAFCVVVSLAVNVTINKYGSQWSELIVITLWLLALIPFIVWLWYHERLLLTRGWIAEKFRQHPISYSFVVVMFCFILSNTAYHIVTRQWKRIPPPKSEVKLNPVPALVSPSLAVVDAPTKESIKKSAHLRAPKLRLIRPSSPVQTATPAAVTQQQSPPVPPTYSIGQCDGSACAQGPGSQATFNQFGPPPLKIEFSSQDQKPFNQKYEYLQRVSVIVNVEFHPVSLAFICTGEVNEIDANGVFYSPRMGIDPTRPNIAYLYYPNPGLAAGVPLEVYISSHTPFKVTQVLKAKFD